MEFFKDPISTFLGTWAGNFCVSSICLRLFFAIVLSAIIGTERATKRHSAGLRTFALVSLGAACAVLIDCFLTENQGPHLISAAVMVGISIICINSIVYSSRNQIKGLTTSVGLWTCCLLGLACGAGCYTLALIIFAAIYCVLSVFPSAEIALKDRSNHFEIHLELINSVSLQNFVSTIRKLGMTIDDIELNPAYTNSGLSVYTVSISISSEELKKYKTHKEIIDALGSLDYVYHIEEMRD